MNDQPPELPKPAKQAANCKPLYDYAIGDWFTIVFRLSMALLLFGFLLSIPLYLIVGFFGSM